MKNKKWEPLVAMFDGTSDNEYEYDDFETEMAMVLKKMGDKWTVRATNTDWMGGEGEFTTDEPELLISAILFHEGRCVTEVYRNGKGLKGVCYHHDVPLGTNFTITKTK